MTILLKLSEEKINSEKFEVFRGKTMSFFQIFYQIVNQKVFTNHISSMNDNLNSGPDHIYTLSGKPDNNSATSKEHFLGQNFANEQKAAKNVQQNNKVIATKHKPSCQK